MIYMTVTASTKALSAGVGRWPVPKSCGDYSSHFFHEILLGIVLNEYYNGNSGENPNRFNVKRDKISTQRYFATRLLLNITAPRPSSKSVAGSGVIEKFI